MRFPFRRKAVSFPDRMTFTSSPPFDGPLDRSNPDNLLPWSYATWYERHPAVHSAVDLLSSSFAQIPFEVLLDATDGPERFRDGRSLEQAMLQPGYQFSIAADLAIHGEHIALMAGSGTDRQFVRLDPESVEVDGKGSLVTRYRYGDDSYSPEQVIHVKRYNPSDPLRGCSPLKSIKDVLEEDRALAARRVEDARGNNRIIERPLEAPDLSEEALARLGLGFSNIVKSRRRGSPVLEEGMTLKAIPPEEMIETRRIVWDIVAATYGIPAAMLAPTSSDRNADSAKRSLYADTLQPLVDMVEDELKRRAVPAFYGPERASRIFIRGNLSDKLKGSFREQSQSFALATGGRAWMSSNDVRAMLNLSPLDGGDDLAPAPTAGQKSEPQPIHIRVEPADVKVDVPPSKFDPVIVVEGAKAGTKVIHRGEDGRIESVESA